LDGSLGQLDHLGGMFTHVLVRFDQLRSKQGIGANLARL
jgi:hypothetical protein